MTYYENEGWKAREQGKSRVNPYRGSAGAAFRRGYDACDQTMKSQASV